MDLFHFFYQHSGFPFADLVGETVDMVLTSEAEFVCRPSVGVGVTSSGGALRFPFREGVALRWGRSSSESDRLGITVIIAPARNLRPDFGLAGVTLWSCAV